MVAKMQNRMEQMWGILFCFATNVSFADGGFLCAIILSNALGKIMNELSDTFDNHLAHKYFVLGII